MSLSFVPFSSRAASSHREASIEPAIIARLRTAREGVTLRHWTADSLSFVGGPERPSPGSFADELADRRRLNLVASKLSRLKTEPIALNP